MMIKFKIFEKLSIKDEILTYLLKNLNNDKKEYKYIWNDTGWLYTEFMNFVTKDYTSYIYKQFHNKYNYNIIEDILIEEYPEIYEDVVNIIYNIKLKDYLINRDTKKYNL